MKAQGKNKTDPSPESSASQRLHSAPCTRHAQHGEPTAVPSSRDRISGQNEGWHLLQEGLQGGVWGNRPPHYNACSLIKGGKSVSENHAWIRDGTFLRF